MKHQKHAKLTKPELGNFGRNEWAIIGTPCGDIQKLAYDLTQILQKNFKVSYVDADHKNADEPTEMKTENPALAVGASLEYTDKITHHRFDLMGELDDFQYRSFFNAQDLILVNGNHFKAQKQIVVIDPRKEKSLEKKLDRLTDVDLILLTGEQTEPFEWLKKHLQDLDKTCLSGRQAMVLHISETQKIAGFLLANLFMAIPELKGLVLAGGKSMRMGTDKGALDYHGKPQREYMADMLQEFCEETFISVRADQEIESVYTLLQDSFSGLGPYGAILSAMREDPNAAWLVVACDLPLLNEDALRHLVIHRNTSKMATAFYNPETEFPEPLITIWEPRSYPLLLQFLAQGYSCPRKVLINSEIELLEIEDVKALLNVNDKEGFDAVRKAALPSRPTK